MQSRQKLRRHFPLLYLLLFLQASHPNGDVRRELLAVDFCECRFGLRCCLQVHGSRSGTDSGGFHAAGAQKSTGLFDWSFSRYSYTSARQRPAAPQAPVQLIIQLLDSVMPVLEACSVACLTSCLRNSSSVTTSQQVPEMPPEPPKMPKHVWELSRKDLVDFWASPLNRVCLLGLAGFLLWIYHDNTQLLDSLDAVSFFINVG